MTPAPRLIAHLDMDAFYASVELLRYPELRGRPVVIGGRSIHQPVRLADGRHAFSTLREYVGRGVVTTSTYEARALGVHSAMGVMKAAALAPDAVLLPADFDEYRRYSRLFKDAVRTVAPEVEDRGIDELYADLSRLPGAHLDGGRSIGERLRDAVRRATGLTCSVGVTPNKLLSKLCSEFDKPDGLTLLDAGDLRTRVWPLPARKVNGIGPKASEKLARLGLDTIGDIAAADPAWLVTQFGRSFGAWLHAAAHGRDDRPVVTSSSAKSISRETTFERDLHAVRDRAELGAIFTGLCSRLAADLERKHCAGRTIGIKLRFDDFSTVTRDLTLPAHTCDAAAIREAAGRCLKRVDLSRRLRLLGVRAAALASLDAPGTEALAADGGRPGRAARRPQVLRHCQAQGGATLPLFDADELPLPSPGSQTAATRRKAAPDTHRTACDV